MTGSSAPADSRRSSLAAAAALLGATVVWGSTFVVTKEALDSVGPGSLLAWRFGIAALVLNAVGGRRARALTREERRHGLWLGFSWPRASCCRRPASNTRWPACRAS